MKTLLLILALSFSLVIQAQTNSGTTTQSTALKVFEDAFLTTDWTIKTTAEQDVFNRTWTGLKIAIANENELQLVYNSEKTAQPISLIGSWKDLVGTVYSETATLDSYRSKVLFFIEPPKIRTKGISAGNNKAWGINGVPYGL